MIPLSPGVMFGITITIVMIIKVLSLVPEILLKISVVLCYVKFLSLDRLKIHYRPVVIIILSFI